MTEQDFDKQVEEAWNLAEPIPDRGDRLNHSWTALGSSSKEHIKDVVRRATGHLPQQPEEGDWQRCSFDDVRKGEHFLVEAPGWHFQGVARDDDADVVCVNPRTGAWVEPVDVRPGSHIKLYRIPRQQAPPDPDLHDYILVHEFMLEGEGRRRKPLGSALFESDGTGYTNQYQTLQPTSISRWDALGVVDNHG